MPCWSARSQPKSPRPVVATKGRRRRFAAPRQARTPRNLPATSRFCHPTTPHSTPYPAFNTPLPGLVRGSHKPTEPEELSMLKGVAPINGFAGGWSGNSNKNPPSTTRAQCVRSCFVARGNLDEGSIQDEVGQNQALTTNRNAYISTGLGIRSLFDCERMNISRCAIVHVKSAKTATICCSSPGQVVIHLAQGFPLGFAETTPTPPLDWTSICQLSA